MARIALALLTLVGVLAVAAGQGDEEKEKKEKDKPPAEKKTKDKEKAKEETPPEPKEKEKDATPPGETKETAVRLASGKDLPGPFHPYNVTGPRAGKYHCFLSQHGLNPMVLILIRDSEASDALKSLLQKLDAAIEKNPAVHLGVYAVFLPEELKDKDIVEEDDLRDQLKEKLEDLAKQEPPLKHVVLALASRADLGRYALDDDAVVTVVLYRKYRIESLHALPKDKLTDEAVAKILSEVATKLGATKK